MKKPNILKTLVAGAALALPLAASANLVVDGDFNQPGAGSGFQTYFASGAGTPVGAWLLTEGSIDLIGGYWNPSVPGQQSVDLAGFFANGKIQQTIQNTVPGMMYELQFDLAGNPDSLPLIKTVEVGFGGATQQFTFDTTGATHSQMNWVTETLFVTATGNNMLLSFKDVTAPGTAFGAVIDNVSVVPVPEPSTYIAGALVLLPFGLGVMRRFKR